METISIQGYNADYFCLDSYRVLLWENEDDYLFMIQCSVSAMDQNDFLRVAEGVKPYPTTDIAYQVEWVPSEHERFSYYELSGAVQARWSWRQLNLTWLYVVDPICPFVLPEDAAEKIPLNNGSSTQYWTAQEPPETGSTTITIGNKEFEYHDNTIDHGDITIGISGDADEEQVGTLAWSDPETNTFFLLKGPLNQEKLVVIANSITEKEPEIDPIPSKTFRLSGTTYTD